LKFLGSGFPPLHVATSKGSESIVDTIISKRCNLMVRDENQKQTALHIAASLNKLKIAEALTKAMPSLMDAPDGDGKTPLHIAAEFDNAAIVKFLISCGATILATDKNLDTPLHLAAVKGTVETIQSLVLATNENTNVRNKDGWLPRKRLRDSDLID
jgi:cytohesin